MASSVRSFINRQCFSEQGLRFLEISFAEFKRRERDLLMLSLMIAISPHSTDADRVPPH